MQLPIRELLGRLPRLHSQDKEPNPLVRAKFVAGGGSIWKFYVIDGNSINEGDVEDAIFSGLLVMATGFQYRVLRFTEIENSASESGATSLDTTFTLRRLRQVFHEEDRYRQYHE